MIPQMLWRRKERPTLIGQFRRVEDEKSPNGVGRSYLRFDLGYWIFPLLCSFASAAAFDGRPWNVSSGNLSVSFIQASPIGAFPRTNFFEPPPSVESQVHLKSIGLVANEDYIAWGAVERPPG